MSEPYTRILLRGFISGLKNDDEKRLLMLTLKRNSLRDSIKEKKIAILEKRLEKEKVMRNRDSLKNTVCKLTKHLMQKYGDDLLANSEGLQS